MELQKGWSSRWAINDIKVLLLFFFFFLGRAKFLHFCFLNYAWVFHGNSLNYSKQNIPEHRELRLPGFPQSRVCVFSLWGKLSTEGASAVFDTKLSALVLEWRFKKCSIAARAFSASYRDQYHLYTTAGAFVKKSFFLWVSGREWSFTFCLYMADLSADSNKPLGSPEELCCLCMLVSVSWKGEASSSFYWAPLPKIYHYWLIHAGTKSSRGKQMNEGQYLKYSHQLAWLADGMTLEGSQTTMVGCEAIRKNPCGMKNDWSPT